MQKRRATVCIQKIGTPVTNWTLYFWCRPLSSATTSKNHCACHHWAVHPRLHFTQSTSIWTFQHHTAPWPNRSSTVVVYPKEAALLRGLSPTCKKFAQWVKSVLLVQSSGVSTGRIQKLCPKQANCRMNPVSTHYGNHSSTNCWLCLGNQSANTIQCIHWLKRNALIPGETFVINITHKLIWMQSMLREDLLIGEYTYLWGCFPANPQIALCALCRKRVPSTPKEKVHCEDTTLKYSWCQNTHNRTAPVSTSNCKGSKLTEVTLCRCVLVNSRWPQ